MRPQVPEKACGEQESLAANMQKRRCECAFTLVELLVVIALLGVLSRLSVSLYRVYKEKAYNSMADHMMRQAQHALEAGRTDGVLLNPPGWRFVQVTTPGPMQNAATKAFLPGLVNPKNMVVWVERNGFCEMGQAGEWCITDWIDSIHCKGTVWKSKARLRNGTELNWEWQYNGGWPCPS